MAKPPNVVIAQSTHKVSALFRPPFLAREAAYLPNLANQIRYLP